MSGHSKWATIHRAKEVKDQARGKLFSKISRIITIATKTGGGSNPDSNFKLKDAIEKARAVSMPKDNIDRAINKASESGDLFEVVYEGFGPAGVAIIVEAATDNKNRTVAEIKNIFEKGGGSVAGQGAVSYNFEQQGLIVVVKKKGDIDSQTLELIDLGAGDIEDQGENWNVYIGPTEVKDKRQKIENAGFVVKSVGLMMKPKTKVVISDKLTQEKIVDLLDLLEEHDDVSNVFENADF